MRHGHAGTFRACLPSLCCGACRAEVLPEWIRWHREFWRRHQQPAEYAYSSRFPRILPFLGWDVSRAAESYCWEWGGS